MEEHQLIEWKESWRDEYLKWICGFANAQGGMLVIGKNDEGEVVGLMNAKRLLEEIPNKIKDILGVVADVDLRNEDDKNFIEIQVEAYPYPVNYKGQYHYRSGSTKQELTGGALTTFLLKKYGLQWDAVPLPNLSSKELELEAFRLFAQKAVRSERLEKDIVKDNPESILKKLHMYEGRYLKRAAAILFHHDPEEFVTGAYIKIGFFRTDSDLAYQDEIHGNLFQQVDQTLDLLLTKYMKASIRYEGLQRVEQFPFPVPALREALLNALVHKDYSSGNPVQISVYETKIIFWNAGKLPEQLTLELLQKKHPSIPFNPLIAAVFFRAGYIETWGRGIEKINKECLIANLPLPEINYEYTGMMISFFTKGKTSEKTSEKASEKTSEKTSEKILRLIDDNFQITINEMVDKIGVSQRSIERNLKKLQGEHKLERIGPDKGGYWKVIG